MTKNFKYFLIAFLAGIPVWWGAGILGERLENFFYWFELSASPQLLAAEERQVSFQNQILELKPLRNKNISEPTILAKSAISLLVNDRGKERILFEKEKDRKLPIASLTKLMTAKIVLDNYDLSKEIKISEEAVNQEESFGKLSAGKVLQVKYLLYPLLMESSNDAAFALANDYDGATEEEFIRLMNEESQELRMTNTWFFNPTGLDSDSENQPDSTNYSTAADLAKLTESLLRESLLWEILTTSKFDTFGPELINTNELLGKLPGIVGGKTGYTEKALGCFVLVLEAPKDKGYILNVVLGANGTTDRFREMEKLVSWVNEAYKW